MKNEATLLNESTQDYYCSTYFCLECWVWSRQSWWCSGSGEWLSSGSADGLFGSGGGGDVGNSLNLLLQLLCAVAGDNLLAVVPYLCNQSANPGNNITFLSLSIFLNVNFHVWCEIFHSFPILFCKIPIICSNYICTYRKQSFAGKLPSILTQEKDRGRSWMASGWASASKTIPCIGKT